jgi:SAM-dependent methyltransferase
MSESKKSLCRRLFPVSSAMSTLFPKLVTGEIWDREYSRGDWDSLFSDDQLAHYLIILGYLLKADASAHLLEVGCGAGRLFELIKRVGFGSYLGLDISQEAIARARALAVGQSSFEVADAYSFSTDQRFDVIIFNEVAYYFKKPAEVLLRYAGFLRNNGLMIVSMYEFFPAWFVWRRLDRVFNTLDTTRVQNRKGQKWQIRLLSKRTR